MDSRNDFASLPDNFQGGSAREFHASLASISIEDGNQIRLVSPGIVMLTGGNNVGKSTLLNQMRAAVAGQPEQPFDFSPKLLSDATFNHGGSLADLAAWFGDHGLVRDGSLQRNDMSLYSGSIYWPLPGNPPPTGMGQVGQAISGQIGARDRFQHTHPVQRRSDRSYPAVSPLHRFEDDLVLLDELDSYSREIFGVGITLDFLSGNLMIRVGSIDVPIPPADRISEEYWSAMANLVPLERQGDGMASTLGLLIPLVASQNLMSFVDEPEAFLHPPQAFKLGQVLAKIAHKHSSQIIAATHDKNLVAGALSLPGLQCTVIRLERSANKTTGYAVDNDRLRSIWRSPLLRHSNVLDGLFHRAVVIAENERDCVFYAASLSHLDALPDGLLPSDVLFLSAHGKAGAPELASILTSAHVPVVVAADMDLLDDEVMLKRHVAATGGSWTEGMSSEYRRATAEFRVPRYARSRSDVLTLITSRLSNNPQSDFTAEDKRQVSKAMAQDNPWRSIKQYGLAAFRSGRRAAETLVEALDREGVVLVRVGELEGFAPALQEGKGAAWIQAALNDGAHESPDAKEYARLIVNAILAAEHRMIESRSNEQVQP